jgi:GNAT superfamily N-acetyltransferase
VSDIAIREAMKSDADVILSLLYELAEYEKLTAKFRLTRDIIERDFFGPDAACHCDLAYLGEAPVGLMTWYRTYASFAASRGIFLEDIFVQPNYRGKGIGKLLLAHLSRRAVTGGITHIDWFVLDWNKPSIEFYERLGAEQSKGWLSYRLGGRALKELADT